jgi:hypothetical protein
MAYNGYTNHETWLVSLWMEEPLREMIQENEECNARDMYDFIYEFIEDGISSPASLRKDLIISALGNVNCHELHDLYTEDNPA